MAEGKKLTDEQTEKVSGGWEWGFPCGNNKKPDGSDNAIYGSAGKSVSEGVLNETHRPTIGAEEKMLTDEQTEQVFGGDASYSTTTPDPTVSTGIWDVIKNAVNTAD